MKNILPAFILLSTGLLAQPTFTANDIYGIGDFYQSTTVNNPSAIDVNITGANSVWNFSGLQGGAVTDNVHTAPTGQPGASNFPQATMAQNATSLQGNQGTIYLQATPTGFFMDGLYVVTGAGETVIDYAPNMELFRFPFTFNSTFTSPVIGTTEVAGYTYFREGTQTAIVDGFGTLTTPLGTFQNVLRQKTTQVFTDSVNIGGFPQIISYESVAYNWISVQSKGVSLLTHSSITVNGGTPSISSVMGAVPTVSIEEASDLNFGIFPNPVSDLLSIQLPSNSGNISAAIFSVTGQLVSSQTATGSSSDVLNIPVGNLASGTYFVRISNGNNSGMKRFVII